MPDLTYYAAKGLCDSSIRLTSAVGLAPPVQAAPANPSPRRQALPRHSHSASSLCRRLVSEKCHKSSPLTCDSSGPRTLPLAHSIVAMILLRRAMCAVFPQTSSVL